MNLLELKLEFVFGIQNSLLKIADLTERVALFWFVCV